MSTAGSARGRKKPSAEWQLRLYVAGQTPKSVAALDNLKRLCESHLAGRYELEIIDISLHPERVREAQIIAAPTLVKKRPLPEQRVIGDMSRTEGLLQRFALAERAA
jgi:circadian clock protein KaiB